MILRSLGLGLVALWLAAFPIAVSGSAQPPAPACASIVQLSTRWHDLAEYIVEQNGDGEGLDNDAEEIVRESEARLRGPTRSLANLLTKGNPRLRALGRQLLAMLDELNAIQDDEGWEEDVRVMDRLADVLDTLVSMCAPPE